MSKESTSGPVQETQESISQWAEETFGPVASNFRMATRANEEMAELLKWLALDENHPKASEEAADVAIVLARLATRLKVGWPDTSHSYHDSMRPTLYGVRAGEALSRMMIRLESDQRPINAADDLWEVIRWLRGVCKRLGTNLDAEIDKKMAVNRARMWKLDGSGHGYHSPSEAVKAEASLAENERKQPASSAEPRAARPLILDLALVVCLAATVVYSIVNVHVGYRLYAIERDIEQLKSDIAKKP